MGETGLRRRHDMMSNVIAALPPYDDKKREVEGSIKVVAKCEKRKSTVRE